MDNWTPDTESSRTFVSCFVLIVCWTRGKVSGLIRSVFPAQDFTTYALIYIQISLSAVWHSSTRTLVLVLAHTVSAAECCTLYLVTRGGWGHAHWWPLVGTCASVPPAEVSPGLVRDHWQCTGHLYRPPVHLYTSNIGTMVIMLPWPPTTTSSAPAPDITLDTADNILAHLSFIFTCGDM